MPRETSLVRAFLDGVSRRLVVRSAAYGIAAGLAPVVVAGLFGWPDSPSAAAALGIAAVIIGILISILTSRSRGVTPALFVERQLPASRNLIATAAELSPSAVGYVPSLVIARAEALIRPIGVSALVPVAKPVGFALVALVAWLGTVSNAGHALITRDAVRALAPSSGPVLTSLDASIAPPSYSGRRAETLRDPSRIEALVGSRVTLSGRARARRVAIETLTSHDTLAPHEGRFSITIPIAADGYVTVQPLDSAHVGARRLIGISAMEDATPVVKIAKPGHDVVLKDGSAALDIAIDATDDIGLGTLALRYTKVSGSGERFSFAEGEVPITVARTDARHWTANVHWALASLALEPGDMVVYHAAATDRRPNAVPSESDAYIAQVAAPGGEAAAGFELDPDQDRAAVSQQMVIVKTERLLAQKTTLSKEDYASQSADLAAEQRKVRAEFVFMLGGELADAPDPANISDLNEEQEAAGEADILAGRNANAGHIALLKAIRAMSLAATSLNVADVEPALPQEKAALAALETAFSRARIILRALTTRERLDMTRRLSGSLSDAARETHPRAETPLDARTVALRRALSDIAAISAHGDIGPSASTDVSAIGERILRADPSSKQLQMVASALSDAARDIAANRQRDARVGLDRAAVGLSAAMRSVISTESNAVESPSAAALNGALIDALRRTGARP